MAADKRGLGRGIDTLFRNATATQEKTRADNEITTLSIGALIPCPSQPRKIFEDRPLEELAESIRKQGIIQPLLVRPLPGQNGKYEIVAGERRFRAAKLVGLASVPVCVRDLSDTDAMAVALVENLQREDLSPIEEAEAIQALRESLNISQDELATRLGKSRSAIANTLRLLQLSGDMRAALSGNTFTPGHARALLAIQDDEEAQRQLFEVILERQLTVRDAENAAQYHKKNGTLPPSLTGEEEQPRQNPPRGPKPELVRDVQRLLRMAVHPKVTVSGNGDLGRVSIPYESAEALAELLRKLGNEELNEANPLAEAFSSDKKDAPNDSNAPNESNEKGESNETLTCEEQTNGLWDCAPETIVKNESPSEPFSEPHTDSHSDSHPETRSENFSESDAKDFSEPHSEAYSETNSETNSTIDSEQNSDSVSEGQ